MQGSGCDINASHMLGSGCEINASLTISRRQLVMARPRASRSSSHRDERWEGVGFDMHAWGRLVVLRRQFNSIFFNQSQLVLYRLLFISYRFFFTRHRNPETLEAPGRWNLGTLEPRVCAYLSRSTPRLISTFSHIGDVVSTFVYAAARGTLLLRRGAAARSTPLTPSVVAILFWTDRGHHVPALTVTSGGRDVRFDMHVWGRLTIAHFEATSQPSSFSLSLASPVLFSSFVLPLRPFGLGLSPGRGDPLRLTVCSTTLRTQARPAIEFVSGKGGLRPF